MIIGGLQKLTLIDFPGKLAATVFLAGCNFRCPWCYSSEIVLPEKIAKQPRMKEEEFFNFLRAKRGMLEGVAICGGEPMLNSDLPNFIKKIKKLDYAVKVDTNGSFPGMMNYLISKNLVDYIAMDLKAPKEKYDIVAGKKTNVRNIELSVSTLLDGKVDYEFRTTVTPGFLDKEDILKMAKWIYGAKRYYLQNFKPGKNILASLTLTKPYPDEYLVGIKNSISPFFGKCEVR